MCGIFGYIASKDKPVNLERLAALATATERRGPHAWGLAWIDGEGRMRAYKQAGRVTSSLAVLRMAEDARMLIGHCRLATHGDPENNLNNHPHRADRGWIVHNGVVRNYLDLIADVDLFPVTQCDSEVLGLLIERFKGRMLERVVRTVNMVTTEAPLAMMGLWSRPNQMVVVRRGNPLSVGTSKIGTYFASLPYGLPKDCREVPDGTAIQFTRQGGKLYVEEKSVKVQPPLGVRWVDSVPVRVEGEGQRQGHLFPEHGHGH